MHQCTLGPVPSLRNEHNRLFVHFDVGPSGCPYVIFTYFFMTASQSWYELLLTQSLQHTV